MTVAARGAPRRRLRSPTTSSTPTEASGSSPIVTVARKCVLQEPTEVHGGRCTTSDYPDDADELIDTAERACDVMGSPVVGMYARL